MPTGESVLSHRRRDAAHPGRPARGRCRALRPGLFAAAAFVPDAEAQIEPSFGEEVVRLVKGVRQLLRIGAIAVTQAACRNRRIAGGGAPRAGRGAAQDAAGLRAGHPRGAGALASRLQTLRWLAQTKTPPLPGVARETLDIYAPLANRLGIWQMKWELEDLAFRFEQPDTYKRIAKLLDESASSARAISRRPSRACSRAGGRRHPRRGDGRPKHIYSIWKKMRGKELDFAELYDVRAFRVIVDDIKDCYTVLGIVHHIWQPIPREFDDYISRPKANGYKSLHTVVIGDDGRALEVQIRTQEMHHFAEYGVAAHWRYKERAARATAASLPRQTYDEKIAWLRQLLAWKDEPSHRRARDRRGSSSSMRPSTTISTLTPQARGGAAAGATPVDFATTCTATWAILLPWRASMGRWCR
jgi:GTP pyrophosphokinase